MGKCDLYNLINHIKQDVCCTLSENAESLEDVQMTGMWKKPVVYDTAAVVTDSPGGPAITTAYTYKWTRDRSLCCKFFKKCGKIVQENLYSRPW